MAEGISPNGAESMGQLREFHQRPGARLNKVWDRSLKQLFHCTIVDHEERTL